VIVVDVVLLVVVVLLLAFTALLSAIETVLQRLDLVRALAIDDEEHGAEDLVWIIEHRGSCLNVTLVLTVLSRIAAVAIAVVLANGWWPGGAGAAIAALVVAVLTLVLAEVAPRSMAMKSLDRTGLRLAPLTRRMVRGLEPLARLFVVVGRAVAGARPGTSGPFVSDEPASEPVVDDHEDPAELEEDERAMIRSIVELGDTIAREIMVPRPDMVIVDESQRLRDLVNTVVQHGVSRVPVCRDDRDHIVGIIYAKDVLRRVALQPDRTDWADLVRPATFIPETKRIDDLLRELQAQSVHIAIVVDEYGATTGLVTIEDILEEIVGRSLTNMTGRKPWSRWSMTACGPSMPACRWTTSTP
jgi:CBS domain containing-hemolysin-like protein